MANMFGSPIGGLSGRFEKEYSCYPVSFAAKDDMEKGNKILLPPSALGSLARMNITWPMLFEMSNPQTDRTTHSGVLEFIAEEGTCYMPYWMMQNLLLKEGDIIRIRNISLPKGQYVKLQPVTRDFLEISNPKAVLENALRNYATLTVGDNFVIQYLDRAYEIEVVEIRPAHAVSIIETDIEVDFQAPKDYTEPPLPESQSPSSSSSTSSSSSSSARGDVNSEAQEDEGQQLFGGAGVRLDGKTSSRSSSSSSSSSSSFVPPPRKLSSAKMSNPVETTTVEVDEQPWKRRLVEGVRTYNAEYEELLRLGRIPGIVGKVRGNGVHRGTGTSDPNFQLFSGTGNIL